MPKRESDSRLDDVLVGYLKRRKYRKTLELLEKTHTHESDLENEETVKKGVKLPAPYSVIEKF